MTPEISCLKRRNVAPKRAINWTFRAVCIATSSTGSIQSHTSPHCFNTFKSKTVVSYLRFQVEYICEMISKGVTPNLLIRLALAFLKIVSGLLNTRRIFMPFTEKMNNLQKMKCAYYNLHVHSALEKGPSGSKHKGTIICHICIFGLGFESRSSQSFLCHFRNCSKSSQSVFHLFDLN